MNGFINMLKPPGMSSSDVVATARKITGQKKCGHSGTLDPLAAGVLPLCMGRATKLFDTIMEKDKEYLAELTLGFETDTQDADGVVIATGDPAGIGEAAVERALIPFRGLIQQQPPMYSALVRDGQKLYKIARSGQTVEREHREIEIRRLELVERTGAFSYLIRIACSKGTYVRTLCADIGRALGCFGTMTYLLRTASGVFSLENAVTPEELSALAGEGRVEEVLLPMDYPLQHLPRADCPAFRAKHLLNGLPQPVNAEEAETVRVYIDDVFYGLGAVYAQDGRNLLKMKIWLIV